MIYTLIIPKNELKEVRKMIDRTNGKTEVAKIVLSASDKMVEITNEAEEGFKMKYYMIINKQRVYFDFNYAGFRDSQKYLLDHGISKRKLHIES
jgi:hypothetical protein